MGDKYVLLVFSLLLLIGGLFSVYAVESGVDGTSEDSITVNTEAGEAALDAPVEDEEAPLDVVSEAESEFSDVQELDESSGGTAPDSTFYFVDEFFDRFDNKVEVCKEKVAELKAMYESGNQEAVDRAYRNYQGCVEELTENTDPEQREEILRGAVAIKKTLKTIDNIDSSVADDIEKTQEELAEAVEIASKIKELCTTLARLDAGEFYRTCRTEADSPKWQQDLFEGLTAEQEKEARIFADVIGTCMRTEGEECECEKVPHAGFAEMCSTVAPLATACSEGDENACEKMDSQTEEMFEILEDAPHLQSVLERLESANEERFDNEQFLPPECKRAGATDRDSCMKVMIRENTPEECLEEFENNGYPRNEREGRERCERIMFELNAPEECIAAGLSDHKECGMFMFNQNAPEECIEAGITGEGRNDPRKCEKLMRSLGNGMHEGEFGRGGPGPNCKGIDNAEERLKCYDGALQNTQGFEERFRETKQHERQCAESCRSDGGAWDFSGGECTCTKDEAYDYERYDTRGQPHPGNYQGPPQEWQGQGPPPGWQPPEGWTPEQGPPVDSSESYSGSYPDSQPEQPSQTPEEHSDAEGSDSGSDSNDGSSSEGSPAPTTGSVISGRAILGDSSRNKFLGYFFRLR